MCHRHFLCHSPKCQRTSNTVKYIVQYNETTQDTSHLNIFSFVLKQYLFLQHFLVAVGVQCSTCISDYTLSIQVQIETFKWYECMNVKGPRYWPISNLGGQTLQKDCKMGSNVKKKKKKIFQPPGLIDLFHSL